MTKAEKKKLKYEQKLKEMETITPEDYENLQNKLEKKAKTATCVNIGFGVYVSLVLLTSIFFPLPIRLVLLFSGAALVPCIAGLSMYTDKLEKEFRLNNTCRTKFLSDEEQRKRIQLVENSVIQELSKQSTKNVVVKSEEVQEVYEDAKEL